MLKSVKIGEENYGRLVSLAGELQKHREKPVSIDEALTYVLRKASIMELAGSWKMTDEEHHEMIKKMKAGWSSWKSASA